MQNKQKQEYLKIQKTETQFLDEPGANKHTHNKIRLTIQDYF